MADSYLKPVRGSSYKARGLSPALWSSCPLGQLSVGMIDEGFGFIDDFLSYTEQNKWVHTDAGSSATVVMDELKGGVLKIDSVAGSDTQGAQLQFGGTVGAASFQASADSKIYFEARFKITDIGGATPDDADFLLGLATVDTTLVASGAHGVNDLVAIQHLDDSTNLQLAGVKDGASAVLSGTIGNIVDGTYIKVGFLIDGVTKITPFINGEAKTAITSGIPTDAMTPSIVCQAGAGATDPIMHLDWIAVYQAEQISN